MSDPPNRVKALIVAGRPGDVHAPVCGRRLLAACGRAVYAGTEDLPYTEGGPS